MTAVSNPYITGSYVTGAEHYGREALLDALLRGGGRAYWLVGNRRTGRTSLLRQLEWLALRRGSLVPLYWDMQECSTAPGLGQRLADAVRDALPRLEPLGVPATLAAERDALSLLTHLRRLLMRKGRELLLLCDEADALTEPARTEVEFMHRLHRELTLGAGLRAIVTSTRRAYRLHDICAGWSGPPFLGGFEMSHTLGGLGEAAVKALIGRGQAPRGLRVKTSAAVVAAVRDATGGHPFLVQLLCSRLWSADGALRMPEESDLRVGPDLAGLFDHDWGGLTAAERQIVLRVAASHRASPAELSAALGLDSTALQVALAGLEAQGLVRRRAASYAAGNAFLERWLLGTCPLEPGASAAETSERAADVARARLSEQDVDALSEQLNARRTRLVELELQRAREFLHSPPQVLAEIAQLEIEIAALRSVAVGRVAAAERR